MKYQGMNHQGTGRQGMNHQGTGRQGMNHQGTGRQGMKHLSVLPTLAPAHTMSHHPALRLP